MARTVHIDSDDQLSLAAVGLWHKLRHLHGASLDPVDVMTAHPDPNAWGPFEEQHDLEGPLNELLAMGYAEEQGGRIHLVEEMEIED